MRRYWIAGLTLAASCFASTASAQNARIFDRTLAPMQTGFAPTMDTASWITVPLPPPREVKVNDIVTIRVDIMARSAQEGEMNRRKTSNFDSLLRSWVTLEGLTQVKLAPQTDGDQRIQGQQSGQFRATAEMETMESLKFDIAATVAAVLPNGNIVREAHRKVKIGDETWLHSLSGTCHKDSIGGGNTVLSKDIASLEITKEEVGHVRDSYQRGWLLRFWDRFKAF